MDMHFYMFFFEEMPFMELLELTLLQSEFLVRAASSKVLLFKTFGQAFSLSSGTLRDCAELSLRELSSESILDRLKLLSVTLI